MSIVNFKAVVIGMGVQGNKRASVANKDLLATVDIDKNKADFMSIDDIDDNSYNAVLLCTPDDTKYNLLNKILNKKKHVLVEKPLQTSSLDQIICFICWTPFGGDLKIMRPEMIT